MLWPSATYLLIDLLSLAGPLVFAFHPKSGFHRKALAYAPAILMTAIPFIAWDALFTSRGIWGFNSDYLLGPTFWGLPMEECLFFVCIPFSCLFLHDVTLRLPRLFPIEEWARMAFLGLGLAALTISIVHADRTYTFWVFSLAAAAAFVLASGLLEKIGFKVGHFSVTYAVHLIPFFLVNGFLTAIPIVQYRDSDQIGFRIGTIPVEDTVYSFLLLFMNISLFHFFQWWQARQRESRHSTALPV